jgi:hypothetical protein
MSPQGEPFEFRPEFIVDLFLRSYAGAASPTLAEVHQRVDGLLVGPFAPLRNSIGEIVQEILHRIEVRIGAASVLEDCQGHEPWLDATKRDQWRLWPRLRDFLGDRERLPVAVIGELDRSTHQTLDQLESPARAGKWDRRGLVVGHVQSGKTTHYTALAAKAIDAGYRIVIVLAGMHNSLRSQTHDRIDRQLIGRDSCVLLAGGGQAARLLGVGEYARELGHPDIPFSIFTCTNSSENGDFKDQVAKQVWFHVNEGARLVMVVKKNATKLRQLRDWLRMLLAEQSGSGAQSLIHQPTLFIDDEADQASVNTRDVDQDPTTINGLIRELLTSFARVGFVGYTATPFANIFIDPSAASKQSRFGPDLFPRSFIVSLKAPNNYLGPAVVFGHPGDDSVGLRAEDPLPMYVPVKDSAAWIPSPHRKDYIPGALPDSLKEAISLFILVCSARAARGDERVHNSMLIHATRFVAVQARVFEQVEQELGTLQTLLSHGSTVTREDLETQLRQVWETRLVAEHSAFRKRLGDGCLPLPSWEKVWKHLAAAAAKIRVMKINGTSDDALAYTREANGLSVIAIGGDKLSRGLTLEGLSVSFFLRTSSMFDTLMQMGRWFGYRPRYADLCRVYTIGDLYRAFREIALAIDDLRADLERMALARRTPEDFGLRVRSPSDGLLITATNKLRRGETVQVRFSGELVQALQLPATGPAAQSNREALQRLLDRLPKAQLSVRGKDQGHLVWHNRSASEVLEFLTSYEAYRTHCYLNRCEQLRRYIQDRADHMKLLKWTICLLQGMSDKTVAIGGNSVRLVKRTVDREKDLPPSRADYKQVAGRAEEAIDLTQEQYDNALRLTNEEERLQGKELSPVPGREQVRVARPPEHGLLLLYPIEHPAAGGEGSDYLVSAVVSFPEDRSAPQLTYTVNDIWRAEYGFMTDWDENGQPV